MDRLNSYTVLGDAKLKGIILPSYESYTSFSHTINSVKEVYVPANITSLMLSLDNAPDEGVTYYMEGPQRAISGFDPNGSDVKEVHWNYTW